MATYIMENDVELNDFEIGDRVHFAEGTHERKYYPNGGTVTKKGGKYLYVDFTGHGTSGGGWYPWRFEKIVDQTFNYKVALRKVFDNPSIKLERKLKGNEYNWISCTGTNSDSVYIELSDDYEYRIKPEIVPPIEKFHFLIKAKGKFSVTSKKFKDENAVKAGYAYHVDVIQRLKD